MSVSHQLPSTLNDIIANYRAVRELTEQICEPLETEDYIIQSMSDASPIRWHLAHTTWFFETFFLPKLVPNYQSFHPEFEFLFNSYYNTVGKQFPRPQRGLLSRPTVKEIWNYREAIDQHIEDILSDPKTNMSSETLSILELGLHHEQQHQELMLTDLKHMLSMNPLSPAYHREHLEIEATPAVPALQWMPFDEGLYEIGYSGSDFHYDNESPEHRTFTESFEMGSRLITNGEYLDFIDAGGYQKPEYWLSEGWHQVQTEGWQAPLYWMFEGHEWKQFSLFGLNDLDSQEPVCHVSYFEADAYARWAGYRLPTEQQWEIAAQTLTPEGHFADSGRFHPQYMTVTQANPSSGLQQMFGDVWEWTSSQYLPYPGYQAPAGALGEYNGKFMCNQFVLRGGSCATSQSHIRATYRNFFHPSARWQFSGIRLAR